MYHGKFSPDGLFFVDTWWEPWVKDHLHPFSKTQHIQLLQEVAGLGLTQLLQYFIKDFES
jgi:hypothetical protein